VKVVREHYLRDDIPCGSFACHTCDEESAKLAEGAKQYLVIDTNIALQQIDFLENVAVEDVIIPSIVLQEVKHRGLAVYNRLRALCQDSARRFYVFANEHHRDTFVNKEENESPNDRNDRAIRVVAAWYTAHLPADGPSVLLLSNDVDCRRKAAESGIDASGVVEYARSRADAPELQDLVAAGQADEERRDADVGERAGKRSRVYVDHKSLSEITSGIKAGILHQGALRTSRFNPYEGRIASDSVGQDILISGRLDMNRAMEGDIVAVELLPEDQWKSSSSRLPAASDAQAAGEDGEDASGAEVVHQNAMVPESAEDASRGNGARPTGRVVGIVKRNWRQRGYCGALDPQSCSSGRYSVLFVPVEKMFPRIRIHTRQANNLLDKRIVVAIDGWEADSGYPSGHYVRTLGRIGDKETETEVLLIENDINTSPFTPAVYQCVPQLPWVVSEEDRNEPRRRDLRHICVCSVDPPGCRDIDDALHARVLPNGNWELGVHIADVTQFLKHGSAMDVEAARRGTSVYLVERRIDMLPKALTEDICSLRADVERLTFTILWEVMPPEPNGGGVEVVNVEFTKAVIRSKAALSYQEAQIRIDDTRMDDEVTAGLRRLLQVAKVLRARRTAAGALQLASPEVKFQLDSETLDPLDVGMYQTRDTNYMVEEMMLMANITVAEKILKDFPSCAVLRRHPSPPPTQFEPLLKAAAAVKVDIDVSTSKALADSLDQAVRSDDVYFNKLIRIMTTRCMTQALYFCSGDFDRPEYHHYGLAAPLYTHFTSPIRRYSDVTVHRLLAAAIGLEPLPDGARDKVGMRDVVSNLNERHHNAQMAGRASVELHTLIFFHGRSVLADARVLKLRTNGIIVFVPKYGIEGPVMLSLKGGDQGKQDKDSNAAEGATNEFLLEDDGQSMVSRDGKQRFRVFDKIAVQIRVEETTGRRRHLVLNLVPRETLPESELCS